MGKSCPFQSSSPGEMFVQLTDEQKRRVLTPLDQIRPDMIQVTVGSDSIEASVEDAELQKPLEFAFSSVSQRKLDQADLAARLADATLQEKTLVLLTRDAMTELSPEVDRGVPAEVTSRTVRRSVDQVSALVELASLVLPKRITSEYLGDALEDIEAWADAGMHPWKIQLFGLIKILWAVIYTVRDIAPVGKLFLG